jgi:cell wall-associated NlpC family hydrolase
MAYSAASLRPGDVVLVRAHGLLGVLIEWATTNPFGHAAIVGPRGALVQATWPVVDEVPLGTYARDGWALRPLAGAHVGLRAARAASLRVGTPYGLAELAADAGRDLLHLPLWPRTSPRRFTCSGLVAMAYRDAGFPLTLAPFPSPADLSYSPVLSGPRPWVAARERIR